MSANPILYCTLVSGGGTPIRIADQSGAPYPTTGKGALVFSKQPQLEGTVTITGDLAYTGRLTGPYASPLTTRGDLYYYGGAGNTRLALGPSGTVLTSNGADARWISPGALAGFLPLTGGTLTGPLIGTTATFIGADGDLLGLFSGTTMGFRIVTDATGARLEGVDNTGVGSYQPLTLNGTVVNAPTPAPESDSDSIATTAWVRANISSSGLYLPLTGGTLTGPLGIGRAPTALFDVADTVVGDVAVVFANLDTGVVGSAQVIRQNLGTSLSVSRRLINTFGVGVLHELGTGVLGRTHDFDGHTFRNSAGTLIQLGIQNQQVTFYGTTSGQSKVQAQASGPDVTITLPASTGTLALTTQIPTTLPPNGTAGGDLSGTYPNPTIKPSLTNGQVLTTVAGVTAWATPVGGTGTVTGVSVVSANGFAGTATATATPAITLTTTITGMLKGNGTAISAGTAGTDYMTPANVSAAYQPLDTGLTALSSIGTGIVTNTAADTFTGRTITGTASRLAVTNGSGVAGNPTLDIDSAYVGQATITTLGTVATGTWQGSVIAGQYGGTGIANTGKTITLGGNLTTSGAFASTFTMTGITTVTFPTSGTLATTAQLTAGTVTGISVVSANGFAGTATATATPAITLTTTITGVLKGNGTAISAAVLGTDYGTGSVTTASVVSANGFAGTVATATTTPAITISTTITGLLKGNATAISAATAGTDYISPSATAGITAGYTYTAFSIGTPTNGSTTTLAGANGNYQYLTNNVAAFTIAAPAADTAISLLITNGATAGTITFTGFTVSATPGDALTTTNTSKFLLSIVRINAISTYMIKALQ